MLLGTTQPSVILAIHGYCVHGWGQAQYGKSDRAEGPRKNLVICI
jgi:hypothetical protein